jgi:hypothetical protein
MGGRFKQKRNKSKKREKKTPPFLASLSKELKDTKKGPSQRG